MSEEGTRPLGEWLRQRREELGIDLEQAQTETRIRARYLRALEAEEYASLPDPVVARGFLRNYANYLGLDAQEALRRYPVSSPPPEPGAILSDDSNPFAQGPFRPVPLHEVTGSRSRWLWLIAALIVLLVALVALGWWHYPRLSEFSAWARGWLAPAREPTAVPITAATNTPTATPSAALPPTTQAAPTATPTLLPSPTWTRPPAASPTASPVIYTGIFLELVFTDTSWIQVTVDGLREFQGELPGDTYRSWYGKERIELRVGNAGAVIITLNGERLGTLGALGEVVDRVFEKVGERAAAATLTSEATSTPTPRPTRTPTPTAPPAEPTESPTEPIPTPTP